jgi:1-phosphofructokinase
MDHDEAKIYTCTLNPAIDYYMEFDELELGRLNRAQSSRSLIGGKGINVSRMLSVLGSSSIALGFLGGYTGSYIEEIIKTTPGIEGRFTYLKTPTRINVKTKHGSQETELNGPAPIIEEADVERFFLNIKKLTPKDVLILSGTTVQGQRDLYLMMVEYCQEHQIPFVLDVGKESMEKAISYGPFLIKPNLHELETFFDVKIVNQEDLITYAKKMVQLGASNVLVSLGDKGSYLVNEKTIYFGQASSLKVEKTVGAGDAMVAGFVHRYFLDQDWKEAFKMAIAAANASVSVKDLPKKETITSIFETINLEEVKN